MKEYIFQYVYCSYSFLAKENTTKYKNKFLCSAHSLHSPSHSVLLSSPYVITHLNCSPPSHPDSFPDNEKPVITGRVSAQKEQVLCILFPPQMFPRWVICPKRAWAHHGKRCSYFTGPVSVEMLHFGWKRDDENQKERCCCHLFWQRPDGGTQMVPRFSQWCSNKPMMDGSLSHPQLRAIYYPSCFDCFSVGTCCMICNVICCSI